MRKNPKLFLLQVRKTLVDKMCGKIGRTLCMTYIIWGEGPWRMLLIKAKR